MRRIVMLSNFYGSELVQKVKIDARRRYILEVVIVRDCSSILNGEPGLKYSELHGKNGNPAGDHLVISLKLSLSEPSRESKLLGLENYEALLLVTLVIPSIPL